MSATNLNKPTYQQLEAQLQEAQTFIHALQQGEIDSIIHDNNEISLLRPQRQIQETENALRESERRYRHIVETVQEGICILDTQAQITFANQQLAELLGYSIAELLEHNWVHFVVAEDHPMALELFRQCQQGSPQQHDLRFKHQQGHLLWSLVSSNPLFDEQGHFNGILMTIMDISTRKQIEEQLRHREAQMAEAQRLAHFGHWEFDPHSETIQWSKEIFRMFGFDPSQPEPSYEALLKVIHPDDLPLFLETCERTCRDGSRGDFEYRVILPDGRIRYIEEHEYAVMDDNGQVIKIFGTDLDITARKEAELARQQAIEALQQQQVLLAKQVEDRTTELNSSNIALAQAARVKNDFLAGMSHELRTPLSAILGLSEVLQEGIYGALTTKQVESLKTIEESASHLLAIINDILDIAKIENGHLTLDLQPTYLESLCQGCLRLIKESVHKKSLKISVSFDTLATLVVIDPRRFKQILINLLSNAVKFTPKGGQIGLEIKTNEQLELIHLTVWDTGIGISAADMDRLFEPFVQVDARLARNYEGTGLGLALVRHLVELHGGSITLDSQLGEGSRFTVTLPWQKYLETQLTPEEMQTADENKDTTLDARSPLILLADDNEASMRTYADFLKHLGYRVSMAVDGLEAIAKAQQENPALILMDVQMPCLDGLEATRRIRQQPELKHIPIIALTALAMPGDKERCLEAGVNDYLSKPVSMRELGKTVEQLLNRS